MTASAGISIVIPYFRNDTYLEEALTSAVRQGRDQLALLLSDGSASCESALRIASSYGVSLVRPDLNGPNLIQQHWNFCVDSVNNDLVTLLHDDDRLRPGYVRTMLAAAAAHPTAAAFFCNAAIIGPVGRPRFSFPDALKKLYRPRGRTIHLAGEGGLTAVLRGNFIMCPTLCYRKSRLNGLRFDERWKQVLDLDFIARLILSGETLVGLSDCQYEYRRHPQSATATNTDSMLRFREEIALYRELAGKAAALGWHTAAQTAERMAIVRLHLLYRAIREFARGRLSVAGRHLAWAVSPPANAGLTVNGHQQPP